MSFGREHLYNELFGGDVITPEPCEPCKTYNYKTDHVNCKEDCCTTRHRPANNRKCLRSCCNTIKQRTRCSSAYCPICDVCHKCYCYCECYCYHACHLECTHVKCSNTNPCHSDNCSYCNPPKEVIHCKPVYKKSNKYDKYYCNPYYVQACKCGKPNCNGRCRY